MLINIRKKLKNRNGASSIDLVIGFLIFIILFSFLFDFFFVAYKQHQVSRLVSDITRKIAIQSGLKNATPTNYPGGDKNYITTDEAYDTIKSYMDNLGITNYNVVVTLQDRNVNYPSYNSFTLRKGHPGYNTDFRGKVTVEITYTYKWGVWRSFVPGIPDGSRAITRVGYGEYKHDYSSWRGES